MYMVIMKSWGNADRIFQDGFATYEEAFMLCQFYDWCYIEEGGYEWDLDIREYEV